MKRNDFIAIKGMDVTELVQKAKVLKQELTDLLMDKNMKKLKDTKVIFKRRKDLAQILTVLEQKRLLGELESKKGMKQ